MAQITFDDSETAEIGDNVQTIIKNDKLIILIDLTQTIGESASGKMMGIGNTGGFKPVPGTKTKLNLYIGKKN